MARHYCAESPIVQRKPTPEEIRAAYGKTVPDIMHRTCMSCSVASILYSAAVGHHFARPEIVLAIAARRRLYHDLLTPLEDRDLTCNSGYGMTNIVERQRQGSRLKER